MPLTDPTTVLAAHLRHPIRVGGVVYYSLVTEAGEFRSAIAPDIFDQAGQPVALNAELVVGVIVRVSHDAGAMRAVQVLKPLYDNPFAGMQRKSSPSSYRVALLTISQYERAVG